MTSRPIYHKYEGGASYEPGQVITMSEYQKLKSEGNQKREETKAGNKEAIANNEPRTVIAEVVDSVPQEKRRGRLSALLDQLDELDKKENRTDAELVAVAAKLINLTEETTGLKPRDISRQPSLPPVNEPKQRGSRFGNLVNELDRIDSEKIVADAKALGGITKLSNDLSEAMKNQSLPSNKQIAPKKKTRKLKGK